MADATRGAPASLAPTRPGEVSHLALEATTLGLWDWDVPNGTVFFSAAWNRMLGLPSEDRTGTVNDWAVRVHPDDLAAVEAAVKEHLDGRVEFYQTVHRMRDASGEWRWILDRGKVFQRDPAGRPVRVIGTHMDLTPWKRIEESLVEREARARALLAALPDMTFVNARDGTYLEWNAPTGVALTAPPGVIMGRKVADVFDEPIAREHMARIEAALATGEVQVYEYELPARDGPHSYEARMVRCSGEEVLTVVRNVTEVRAASRALARSAADLEALVQERTAELAMAAEKARRKERLLKALLDNIPDVVWLKDTDGRILAANRPFARTYGLEDPGQLLGKTDFDILSAEQAEAFRAEDEGVMSRRAPRCIAGPFVRPGGATSWVETVKSPIVDDSGAVAGICGISRDVTDRHRADQVLSRSRDDLERLVAERTAELTVANTQLKAEIEERESAESTLRSLEERNRALLEAIPDLIFRLDREGRVLDVRSGSPQDLVRPASELVGQSVFEFLPAGVAALVRDRTRECLASRQKVGFEYSLDLPAGRQMFDARMAPANPDEVVAVVRNISERARLEQLKSDFVNRAAHELRTPVTTISLLAGLLREGGTEEETRKYWEVLDLELKRQRDLIESLLMTGRLERGILDVGKGPSDVAEAIREVLVTQATLAKDKGVELRLEASPQPLLAAGGLAPLVQVFGNLVGNAVKYTPARGRVDVGATRCDGGVRVVVKDSGIGIPADDLPHVAERFFRARNATEAEIPGTGIGLFVSRSIVERLGGTVTFASVESEGTTIEVFLPFAAPEGSGEFRRLQEVGR